MGSLVMSSSIAGAGQAENVSFTEKKVNVAFAGKEKSALIDGFKDELSKIANFVEIPDEYEALQDALYFRKVSYIIHVPEGFSEGFMRGENVRIEKTTVPDTADNVYVDLCIDKYFNTARLYVQNLKGISQELLVRYLKSDLTPAATVEMKIDGKENNNHTYANYYYNYLAYSLFSVIIFGMSIIILVFNNRDLKMRNNCSPLKTGSVNMQFILANLLFAVSAWFVMVLLCFLLNLKNSLSMNTVYFLLSSFVFVLCCCGLSFFIGNLVKSTGAISAVCNIVTLGFCFIGGVFVPQEFLGSFVLKIAGFTPTYWYIKANNEIAKLTEFGFRNVKPILSDLLIILGFGLAFFTAALVVVKKKRYA
jgi:ABC-2 type transport system permease protein